MSPAKVWFITGASTGFGRFMTELVLKKGDIAIATLRKPEVLAELSAKHDSTKLLVLQLDVKQPDQIIAAFDRAKETFGRIDVVFNNAAYATISEVESAVDHEDLVRDQFEVNFWGALHVTQAAVKFFRDVNSPAGGRLLQVSSLAGIQGVPASGFYAASKHALEGLTESLVKEIDPAWNIKVTLIEPGPFRTAVSANYSVIPAHAAYANTPAAVGRAFMDTITDPSTDDPRKAVRRFYDLAYLPEPPLRLPVGKLVVESMKNKAKSLVEEAEAYASWSEGLGSDE